MMAHQRHPRGNQLIREYMLRDYREPKDFESFLYVSQVLQAEGIKIGAEHLRRIMPHNMGSLYWQLNDCWPVASWSSIDYTGRWKALQYYARRFYGELLVSPRATDGNVDIFVVSDRLQPTGGQLNVTLFDFAGNRLWNQQHTIQIRPLSSQSYLSIPIKSLLALERGVSDAPGTGVFLFTEVLVGANRYPTTSISFALSRIFLCRQRKSLRR
jgi:beta-mannosidase